MQTIRTNLNSAASIPYTNHTSTSMSVFNGAILGAGPDGIKKLACGTTDGVTTIEAYIKTGSNTLGWIGKKKNRFIYLGVETSSTIKITPVIDGVDGTAVTFSPSASGMQYMKMSVPNDNIGYYWAYKVENVDGCWFSISEVTVLPIHLSKRK